MKYRRCAVLLLCFACLMTNVFASGGQEIESLIKQLGDEDDSVRRRAMKALSEMGQPAVPALIEAFEVDKSWRIPHFAIDTLVSIGEPAVPQLIEALSYKNKDVRESAIQAFHYRTVFHSFDKCSR